MRKDKKWLKGLINEEGIVMDMNLLGRHDEQYWKNENIKINKGRLFCLIDELDEPETISDEFLKSHSDWVTLCHTGEKVKAVMCDVLRDVIFPKSEEKESEKAIEAVREYFKSVEKAKEVLEDLGYVVSEKSTKPTIPQFVADYIETYKGRGFPLGAWFEFVHDEDEFENKTEEWLYSVDTQEEMLKREYLLIDAIRYGYAVEKEPVYYAKIKGHEFIQRIPTFDEDTGENTSEYYRSVYFVLQSDGDLIVDMKDSGLSGAKHVMTMSQWNNLGINDNNADFEEVE